MVTVFDLVSQSVSLSTCFSICLCVCVSLCLITTPPSSPLSSSFWHESRSRDCVVWRERWRDVSLAVRDGVPAGSRPTAVHSRWRRVSGRHCRDYHRVPAGVDAEREPRRRQLLRCLHKVTDTNTNPAVHSICFHWISTQHVLHSVTEVTWGTNAMLARMMSNKTLIRPELKKLFSDNCL